MAKALLVITFALVLQQAMGQMACPLKFIDGRTSSDGIHLEFRNTGKLPIQQLELSCTPVGVQGARRSMCHEQGGLFYPGDQYEMDFLYTTPVPRTISINLRTARLSDGTFWMASRRQTCKAFTVSRDTMRSIPLRK